MPGFVPLTPYTSADRHSDEDKLFKKGCVSKVKDMFTVDVLLLPVPFPTSAQRGQS